MRITLSILYLLAVVALTFVISARGKAKIHPKPLPPPRTNSMELNPTLNWATKVQNVSVPAHPQGLWTCVYEYVDGPVLLKIEVKPPASQWRYAPGQLTTADGDPTSMLSPKGCLLDKAPIGALLLKVGGSSAGVTDGKTFLVGSFAVIQLDQATRGPIYLSINDEPGGMGNNSGELVVDLSIAKTAASAPAPPPVQGAATGATG